ncbi:hypothetical protein PM8797T_06522 [Gimesia maris DSM 8797]|nr:hypothetical protein PM8797T_06522 [Gimesia maris DSM 8797]
MAIRFFQSVIGVYWFGIFICGASELIFIIIFLGGAGQPDRGAVYVSPVGQADSLTRAGERTLIFVIVIGVCLVFDLWYVCRCMVDYFVEGRGEVKRDER